MKYCIYIFIIIFISATALHAQRSGGGQRGNFSLSNLSSSKNTLPDSLLFTDSTELKNKRIIAYSLTENLGDSYIAPMDTNRLNYANSTLVDGHGLSVAYLGNIGSPAQSRIFSERPEANDFIFADGYNYYRITPKNALYYDVKTPYSNVTYTFSGASVTKEERLKGVLTTNFGKKINIGADFDYIYGRGHYNSNGTKHVNYRLFGSYRSDRYELNAYLSNNHMLIAENGGSTDIPFITNPDDRPESDTKLMSTRQNSLWNRVRNKQYFLTHRYNLGFTRTLENTDEEGNSKEIFVPVSSIIHTFEYQDYRRRFYSNVNNTAIIDTTYPAIYNLDPVLNDRMSSWNFKNTFALSLREGFQDWVKLGLTAFIRFEQNKFRMQAPIEELVNNPVKPDDGMPFPPSLPSLDIAMTQDFSESTTYIGGELYKRQGAVLTYNARGELAVVGDYLGELRLTGELQTRFKLFNKELSFKANGYLKNVAPAFFQRKFYSRYFQWNNNLKNTKQVYVGGEANIEATKTTLSAGVESIENYVFFNSSGLPEQSNNNIQVITARLKQDFHYKALGWENEVVYQLSSERSELPLPQVTAYSNLYLATKLAKVLTVQIGADAHYFTEYDAPYYEPATQQFQLQRKGEEMKVGNYPLVNAYVNFHLKQARFFVMMYNISTLFVEPNYFSLANYPLNPMHLKFGISVNFNN